jgi:hypothetical protein
MTSCKSRPATVYEDKAKKKDKKIKRGMITVRIWGNGY